MRSLYFRLNLRQILKISNKDPEKTYIKNDLQPFKLFFQIYNYIKQLIL